MRFRRLRSGRACVSVCVGNCVSKISKLGTPLVHDNFFPANHHNYCDKQTHDSGNTYHDTDTAHWTREQRAHKQMVICPGSIVYCSRRAQNEAVA
jgi:hypothetical protein